MRLVFSTMAALMLSAATASAQYCDGSEGTGTSGNTVTGTRCPIGQPGWAMPPLGTPAPSDGATVGQDSGKAPPAQKKRGRPENRGQSNE